MVSTPSASMSASLMTSFPISGSRNFTAGMIVDIGSSQGLGLEDRFRG